MSSRVDSNAHAFVCPPTSQSSYMSILCNGELTITPEIEKRIIGASHVIAVDGGMNHCDQMHIIPQWVVGDFDSIHPELLKKFENEDLQRLHRAKDYTDLEVAIENAKRINACAQIIIFGGLGGRIDHTLTNVLILLRDPARLFLETDSQVLFGLNDSLGKTKIQADHYKTLALIPFHGKATNIEIESDEGMTKYVELKDEILFLPHKSHYWIHVGCGDVIVVLDKREITPLSHLPKDYLKPDFSAQESFIHIANYLLHQSKNFQKVILETPVERVENIQPSSGKKTFSVQRGQTLSLIPFNGPAKQIKTKGLKWELGQEVHQLDKSFIGISNVCLGNEFSIELKEGEILCVINSLIDESMIEIEKTKI